MGRASHPLALCVALVALAGGCASLEDGRAARGIERRAWSIGDEWSYRWESPAGKGTTVWTVIRFEAVEGVDSVVVRSGRREIFYRRSDGAHVLDRGAVGVVLRNVPPAAVIAFPMWAGRPWVLDFRRERPEARQSEDVLMDCHADLPAPLTVPRGTLAGDGPGRHLLRLARDLRAAPDRGHRLRGVVFPGGREQREGAGRGLVRH